MALPVFPENKTQILENYSGLFESGLSTVNIALSVAILLQNPLIISCYWNQRDSFSASMYIAIAIVDMIAAQGLIVLSAAGIAVTSRKCELQVLYYCVYYYSATAGFAQNCSKLYNVVLSVVTTMKLKNPLQVLNFRKIRLSVVVLTLGLSVLCLLDVSACLFLEFSRNYLHLKDYHRTILISGGLPGVASSYILICEVLNSQLCYHEHFNAPLEIFAASVLVLFYLVLPPLILLVSGLWLLVLLRRAAREYDDSNNLHNTVRHISVTVICSVLLTFVCNTSFPVGLAIWFVLGLGETEHSWTFFKQGQIFEITGITLPIMSATFFSSILILRSSTLQRKILSIFEVILRFPKSLFQRLRQSLSLWNGDETYPFILDQSI